MHDSLNDKEIIFLTYLTNVLKRIPPSSFGPSIEKKRFRNPIKIFTRKYHSILVNIDNVVIFLSRVMAIRNVLRLFSFSCASR